MSSDNPWRATSGLPPVDVPYWYTGDPHPSWQNEIIHRQLPPPSRDPKFLTNLQQYDLLIKRRSEVAAATDPQDIYAKARKQSFSLKSQDEWASHRYLWRLSGYLHSQAFLMDRHAREDVREEPMTIFGHAAKVVASAPPAEEVETKERELFVKREKEYQSSSRRWLVNVAADCPVYLKNAEQRVQFDCMQRIELERYRRDAAMELGILGKFWDRKKQRIVQGKKTDPSTYTGA
jgi:hypothetical protein